MMKWCRVVVIGLFFLLLSSTVAQTQEKYFDNMGRIIESFEKIQAAIEVSFEPIDYIRRLQSLRYELKKLEEVFGRRTERRSLSYYLAFKIENNYLSVIRKIEEDQEAVPKEIISQVSEENESHIWLLKEVVKVEEKEGIEKGWVSTITSFMDSDDYDKALQFSELSLTHYGRSRNLAKLNKDISTRIQHFQNDIKEAKRLLEQKKFRESLRVLEEAEKLRKDDPDLIELKRAATETLSKIKVLREEAKNLEKEERYEEAFEKWSELHGLIPTDKEAEEKTKLYKEKLKIITTEYITTCDGCDGFGYCPVCKGSEKCFQCEGSRKCTYCKGAGYFVQRCPYCICRKCGGSGQCPLCKGIGTVYCSQCKGMGYYSETKQVTCGLCRGSGKSPFAGQPCSKCGGTGKETIRVDRLCPKCHGSKLEQCPDCGGNGLCSLCKGRGRSFSCSFCRGIGKIITKCRYCNGTGICPVCKGKGVCNFCKGTGLCGDCIGEGVIVTKVDEERFGEEKLGFISVITTPEGADIYVNGDLRGKTPKTFENIASGDYDIRLVKEGFRTVKRKIKFTDNYSVQFDLKLLPESIFLLRVVGISRAAHRIEFKHYSQRPDGSFLASLDGDGTSEWKKQGEHFLGYEIVDFTAKYEKEYSPELGAERSIDRSELTLRNERGNELKIIRGVPIKISIARARIYDHGSKRIITLTEGEKIKGLTVQKIEENQVVLGDDEGNEYALRLK